MRIIIATSKTWNLKNFKKFQKIFPNIQTTLIENHKDLTLAFIDSIKPRFIFFPHWSYRIPQDIYAKYECIVFHMTDLPFGRGGSPLQNLILQNVKKTRISALRVCEVLDGGEIYLKKSLDISKGSAKKIYKKASKIIFFKMIPNIINNKPIPQSQSGTITNFKRRKPEQSNLESLKNPTLSQVYDFIRMLDAPAYPRAFLDFNPFKIEFSSVKTKQKSLKGKFKICKES
ncbi:methionyl-tRNA formyltransferase [Helicobacter sp. MIT 11-5569]|uniref:hypothetical protein n=1 Tax=Helicobacter sp. MIT 11-5569 TaxID=1548151 RepID=UPI00051FB2C4|nr:hypothetical protein [Helicobacter sp. MIT 11-5569]TLD83533.1 methionyl-tRNA formyltransferase [Helicobacter sp. MIT 11-5569]